MHVLTKNISGTFNWFLMNVYLDSLCNLSRSLTLTWPNIFMSPDTEHAVMYITVSNVFSGTEMPVNSQVQNYFSTRPSGVWDSLSGWFSVLV